MTRDKSLKRTAFRARKINIMRGANMKCENGEEKRKIFAYPFVSTFSGGSRKTDDKQTVRFWRAFIIICLLKFASRCEVTKAQNITHLKSIGEAWKNI